MKRPWQIRPAADSAPDRGSRRGKWAVPGLAAGVVVVLAAVSSFAASFAAGPHGRSSEASLPGAGHNLSPVAPTPTAPRVAGPTARPPLQQDFNVEYDGRFTFVRLRFDMSMQARFGINAEGQPPWAHDYPRAERNLAKILDEVSLVAPYLGGSNIFDLGHPELDRYPIAYMSEPGYWTMDDDEARSLRAYLLKGGFLIFDDFRGGHWFNFQDQMRRVLPDHRPVEIDVSHPIFHAFFDIQSLDWRTTYGVVGEYYGFFEDNDPAKRMLAIANYNNDIGDYWEWSDQGWLPIELSNEAYKLGVNYVVYAMTH